jgi:dTDP-glucose pyrophosphorylase
MHRPETKHTPNSMQTRDIQRHTISKKASVRDALLKLNELRSDAILFVTDEKHKLLGSLTDGDLRRGFIGGLTFESPILEYIQPNPIFIYQAEIHLADLNDLKKRHLLIIPIVDKDMVIVKILNLRINYSVIPADVIIMAGGKGERLMPLTKDTPKPMLPVGDKPLLEHQINLLAKYSIKNIYISVNYLASKIKDFFCDGSNWGVTIKYLHENKPLGTLGAIKLADSFEQDYILIINSDILTNIDLAGFFHAFIRSGADMAVAASSYYVQVPYGVLEVDHENTIHAIKEKPSFTYYSNAGIYFVKKELINLIPANQMYNVTDLMQYLISNGKKVISYPILGYWLDIGRFEDYQKAQEDIRYIAV